MNRIVWLTLIVSLVSVMSAAPLYAEIEEVILGVDGLACPFCAYGLEKKMTPIKGMKSYDVDMGEGKVYLELKENAKLDLEAFRKAVKEAGFTLRDVYVRAKGTIEKSGGGYALVLGPNQERLLLFDKEAMGKEYHQGNNPENLVLSKERAGQLEEYERNKKEVRIEGSVHEHQGLPAGLAVEKLEALG
ncbi:MAG: heavy-metal-associated domain-containing protein [Candidatus Omnitrophica bacterium]|nr:heavy-metal-associated domain-containing protein [Candidatus Omnitrophota bacterium]